MTRRTVVTITDVAQRAGVSRTSVSRYLNSNLENLSSETAARIANAVRDLDYRPNAWARSLKTRHSGLIAAVVADLRNEHILAVLDGIEMVVNTERYSLLISNTQNRPDYEGKMIERLIQQRVEGVILQPCDDRQSSAVQSLKREGIRVVLMDRSLDILPPLDTILLDNQNAIDQAMHHVIQQGYNHVLYVTDPAEHVTSRRERETAIKRQDYNTLDVSIFVRKNSDTFQLGQTIEHWRTMNPEDHRVIICANVATTLFTVAVLDQMHIQVPKDMGLMAIDDPPWAPYVLGGITSIAQPTIDLGRTAAERLMNRIQGNDSNPGRVLRLSGHLVERGSTKRVHTL